jgi:2-polyprenyl-6-methoxyphenol hydroxylase-like FAD-dependent oxidoreductase
MAALVEAGAERADPLAALPPTITDRARRPGDERFVALHVRRPILEHALARAADAQPGLTVRRGTGVAGLLTRSGRVTGARTDGGEELRADLVVDAMGRGSRLPRLLDEHGIAAGAEVLEPTRFVYYTRFFRGPRQPEMRAPRLSAMGSFSIVTLNADSDVWSVTVFAAATDRPLKRLRDPAAWSTLVRACPRHAHWLDGEPVTGILPMGGVMDRKRDPAPAPGVVSVADAWACTNPTLGRGIAIGLMHAVLLRDVARDPRGLEETFRDRTARELDPYYRECVASDRVRLGAMEAYRQGREPAPPTDRETVLRAALYGAMRHDADAFRAGLDVLGCLAPEAEVLARPGLAEKVLALGGSAPAPSLARDEVLQLVA